MKRLNKQITVFLAIICLSVFMFPSISKAATITKDAKYVLLGGVDYINVEPNESIETAPESTNEDVVKCEKVGSQIKVTGMASGAAIVSYAVRNNTTQALDWIMIPYNVQKSANITSTMSIAVGDFQDSSESYHSAYNLISSDSSVATASFMSGRVRVYGVKAGSATITGKFKVSESSPESVININVTVYSGSTGSVRTTVGESIAYETTFYDCTNLASDNVNIATARVADGKITITGVAVGTTYIRANVKAYPTSASSQLVITVKVNEASASSTVQETINVEAGKSELTSQAYFLNGTVTTDNSSIATSQIDASGKIKITGVGAGQTYVRAKVKMTSTGTEQEYIYPVVVKATGTQTTTNNTSTNPNAGIYLGSKKSLAVSISKKNKPLGLGNLKLNGQPIKREELLWIGTNDKVMSVTKAGIFKVLAKGKATLIAVTKAGDYVASIEIVIS